MNLKKLEQKRKLGYAALDVMEQHPYTFFVEERYTIADIALYAYTHVAHEGGFALNASQQYRHGFCELKPNPDISALPSRMRGINNSSPPLILMVAVMLYCKPHFLSDIQF